MEVDSVQFSLGDTTDYDSYMDLKPLEKEQKAKKLQESTIWKEDQDDIERDQAEKGVVKQEEKKRVGRPEILGEEHKEHLKKMYGDESRTTVNEAVEGLISFFFYKEPEARVLLTADRRARDNVFEEGLISESSGLKIAKAAVHDFMTNYCVILFKKASFEPEDRSSEKSIIARYDWAVKPTETDIDLQSNHIFIHESAFHINLSRTIDWSVKGTKAVTTQPKTKAKTTTILGAICSAGIVNIKVRVPYEESSKKRKVTGEKKAKKTVGTVIGHYFNFVASTLDVLDHHEHFKGCYLVMDNAPIHNSVHIERLVVHRGYGCIYLPLYSPELNPIEQFWSVVKSRMKRERMLSEETLASRVTDACNRIYLNDLQGLCRHSHSKLQVCLNKEPI